MPEVYTQMLLKDTLAYFGRAQVTSDNKETFHNIDACGQRFETFFLCHFRRDLISYKEPLSLASICSLVLYFQMILEMTKVLPL
jgi:hypothetical protein